MKTSKALVGCLLVATLACQARPGAKSPRPEERADDHAYGDGLERYLAAAGTSEAKARVRAAYDRGYRGGKGQEPSRRELEASGRGCRAAAEAIMRGSAESADVLFVADRSEQVCADKTDPERQTVVDETAELAEAERALILEAYDHARDLSATTDERLSESELYEAGKAGCRALIEDLRRRKATLAPTGDLNLWCARNTGRGS